jgi:hypothetical protein
MTRTLRGVAVTLAAVVTTTTAWAAPAVSAVAYSASLRAAVAALAVAAEVRTGYDRDLFRHWIDADSDGCNTRYEVLISEADDAPTVGAGCSLHGGRWYSYYDNASYALISDLDIDHMVPLAEAWDSGARAWPGSRREAFANDLGDTRPLIAVKDSVNQAKGDRDPAQWLPPYQGATCRYVREWVATKIRWRLTVDSAEKSALTGRANACSDVTITVTYAW